MQGRCGFSLQCGLPSSLVMVCVCVCVCVKCECMCESGDANHGGALQGLQPLAGHHALFPPCHIDSVSITTVEGTIKSWCVDVWSSSTAVGPGGSRTVWLNWWNSVCVSVICVICSTWQPSVRQENTGVLLCFMEALPHTQCLCIILSLFSTWFGLQKVVAALWKIEY